MDVIKLDRLDINLLNQNDSWQVLIDSYEEEQLSLTPVIKTDNGAIPKEIGEVWCLTKVSFSNGDVHWGCSMCRGDSEDGPLLWSVWNNDKFQTLIVSPTPEFVLEVEGLIPFCEAFNRTIEEIFPLVFEVVPKFETEPHVRRKLVGVGGIVSQS